MDKASSKYDEEDSPESTPRFIMLISGSYYKTVKEYAKDLYQKLQRISVNKDIE
jgi:hypothetical protein